MFLRGKFDIFGFLSKMHGGLPEKKCEKNAKKRFVIKIKYFYFIFVVFFYNKCEIIQQNAKNDFCRKPIFWG